MPLLTKCTHCQTPAQVPDNAAGKRVRCPKCKKDFVVAGAAGGRQPAPASVGAAAGSTDNSVELEMGGGGGAAGGGPSACPACGSQMLPGAVACMDCGFLVAGDTSPAQDEQIVVCTNPACGAGNPIGERNCVRCTNPLPTPPGTMINNRYRIEKQLAVGGFGAVYLATDTKQGDKAVAIKDMLCEDPQEFSIRLNFFRREAEILRALEKVPIVPRVFELIQEGQLAHLVLEFIKGQDLLKLMEGSNNRPFPIPQCVEWAKSVCDVLTVMHTQAPPLIHRDLKPDNIMLLEDKRTIKMIDFGTARDMGRSQKSRMASKTRVYTEGYAPPEQIIGKPEARSDLFALAGTLFHLATGKAPEGFYTAQELEQQLKDGSLPKEHLWFFELIKINLAEDINDRYFSAREIKQDLDRKQVTKQVGCPKCKTVNKVREPYCSKCGDGLTEVASPCTQCGKPSRMGSRHCIHCGNRLR